MTGLEKYEIDQGETKIVSVVVTSESGDVKTYSVEATRPEFTGHSSKLSKLKIEGYENSIDFNPLTENYTIEIATNTSDLNIIAEPIDKEAK